MHQYSIWYIHEYYIKYIEHKYKVVAHAQGQTTLGGKGCIYSIYIYIYIRLILMHILDEILMHILDTLYACTYSVLFCSVDCWRDTFAANPCCSTYNELKWRKVEWTNQPPKVAKATSHAHIRRLAAAAGNGDCTVALEISATAQQRCWQRCCT